MDENFKTQFNPNAPCSVRYGFDLSGNISTNSKQLGDRKAATIHNSA